MPRTLLSALLLCVAATGFAAEPAGSPLGGMRLVAGFEHQRLQGIDSTVGRLVRMDGFTISYEKGRIPDPKEKFALGGDFRNAALYYKGKSPKWFREQTVSDVPVHIVLTKDDLLVVTYPKSGINFTAKIGKPTDLADALVVLLTFPGPASKDAPPPRKPVPGVDVPFPEETPPAVPRRR